RLPRFLTLLFSAPRPSHMTRYARPSGQPAAVTPLRFVALVWPRESNQREGHPDIRVWPAARLPSFRCRSGGRHEGASLPRRPRPSFLVRRPCLASPCATPPLSLLTGNGVRVA